MDTEVGVVTVFQLGFRHPCAGRSLRSIGKTRNYYREDATGRCSREKTRRCNPETAQVSWVVGVKKTFIHIDIVDPDFNPPAIKRCSSSPAFYDSCCQGFASKLSIPCCKSCTDRWRVDGIIDCHGKLVAVVKFGRPTPSEPTELDDNVPARDSGVGDCLTDLHGLKPISSTGRPGVLDCQPAGPTDV